MDKILSVTAVNFDAWPPDDHSTRGRYLGMEESQRFGKLPHKFTAGSTNEDYPTISMNSMDCISWLRKCTADLLPFLDLESKLSSQAVVLELERNLQELLQYIVKTRLSSNILWLNQAKRSTIRLSSIISALQSSVLSLKHCIHVNEDTQEPNWQLKSLQFLFSETGTLLESLKKRCDFAIRVSEIKQLVVNGLDNEIEMFSNNLGTIRSTGVISLPKSLSLEKVVERMQSGSCDRFPSFSIKPSALSVFSNEQNALFQAVSDLESQINPIVMSMGYLESEVTEIERLGGQLFVEVEPQLKNRFSLLKSKWDQLVKLFHSKKKSTIDSALDLLYQFLIQETESRIQLLSKSIQDSSEQSKGMVERDYKLSSKAIQIINLGVNEELLSRDLEASVRILTGDWDNLNRTMDGMFSPSAFRGSTVEQSQKFKDPRSPSPKICFGSFKRIRTPRAGSRARGEIEGTERNVAPTGPSLGLGISNPDTPDAQSNNSVDHGLNLEHCKDATAQETKSTRHTKDGLAMSGVYSSENRWFLKHITTLARRNSRIPTLVRNHAVLNNLKPLEMKRAGSKIPCRMLQRNSQILLVP